MSDDQLPDAISAASLVLAVLAALYTLWLPQITKALAIKPARDAANRGGQKSEVMSAIVTKAAPLAAASVGATAILSDRFVRIAADVWRHHADWVYDDVKALMTLTYILIALLTVVALVQLGRLLVLHSQLSSTTT